MSAYNELIKNFEKIRTYMREFYVYGFKNRNEYDKKSPRSYDDARRRIESWLGDYMNFIRTPEGKNMFISIDSRTSSHNPLYKAWKTKSFTDGDITLHFILLDILDRQETSLSLSEILQKINDDYLCCFDNPMIFDESTVRKKLKEYIKEGIIAGEKKGRNVRYHRMNTADLSGCLDMIHFYSETAPCGVVGSFLLDKYNSCDEYFFFKHHYITDALDSDVIARLFEAMGDKREITVTNLSAYKKEYSTIRMVPLRIFISVQNGRRHLLAYCPEFRQIQSFRIDYLSDVREGDVYPDFDMLREELSHMQQYMWGVVCKKSEEHLEHVEFNVVIQEGEKHIINRLMREKRVGTVEKIDNFHYRFSADVYDTFELVPWIRTFICRITELNFSNKEVLDIFKRDLEDMYKLYGLDGGGAAHNDI